MDKELLERYIAGTVSTEEVETVVDWLDEDPAHVYEYKAMHKLYDISILNRVALQSRGNKSRRQLLLRRGGLELLKIAAVFLVFLGGSYLFDNFFSGTVNKQAFQTIYVPAGQRAEITLPDSTKVWLNARSRLTYPTNFEKGVRRIELDGEAYFDVTHNPAQPFIVKTKILDIKVLGTEFNVTAYTDVATAEVSLLKGSVELSSPYVSRSYRMKPKELVRLQGTEYQVSTIDDYDYFRWKDGVICFNNESVGTIIEKLELYYDVKFDIQKKGFTDNYYSGKFRTKDGIEQVLRVLQIEHKFTYTKDNELNLITIK